MDQSLKKASDANKLFLVANNKGDQAYLKQYTGLVSELIPSLCLYPNCGYTGNKDLFTFSSPRGHDLLAKQWASELPELTQILASPYSYETLYDYKGIIHFPYQISTMSIFEQYSANIPLFFPSKTFLMQLQIEYPEAILSEVSYVGNKPTIPGDLNNTNDRNVIKAWIDFADFYDEENMPYIQYFDSFTDLIHKLQTADLKEISQKMKEHNVKRKQMVYEKWEKVMQNVQTACEN